MSSEGPAGTGKRKEGLGWNLKTERWFWSDKITKINKHFGFLFADHQR